MATLPRIRPVIAIVLGGAVLVTFVVAVVRGVLPVVGGLPMLLAGLVTGYVLTRGLSILASPEALAEPNRRNSDGSKSPGPIAAAGLWRTTLGGLGYAGAMMFLVLAAKADKPAPAAAVTPAAAPPASPPLTIEQQVAGAADLGRALALAQSAFTSDGNANAQLLAMSPRLTWRELQATAETTVPGALKDAERERGKRVCVRGNLLDIERKDLAGRPTHHGALSTTDGDTVRFVAVGSTGTLVKRDAAVFCGIVTGRQDAALIAVGMFDLPENASPIVER